ncbi:lysine N(6)-hydroxylase/L-ornithine N(5)-oxygenase family protein [Kineococcus glutinatus]
MGTATDTATGTGPEVLDVVGVGFGPANLALAIAVHEGAGTPDALRARFLERKPAFGWHRGMLLPGASMQVSFLKDLATMRNPASGFSFLTYLHQRGRLVDFVNAKTFFPSRLEFHDYLEWAAAQVDDLVRYDAEVERIDPVTGEGGTVDALDVVVRQGGASHVLRTRNVVFGTGLRPRMPEGVSTGARVWHSAEFLDRLAALPAEPRAVGVLGAGQSAAEVAEHLHTRFPAADVYAVHSRYGYSPADSTPFANRVFDPEAVDVFHGAGPAVREQIAGYHRGTNYSVVDAALIEELHRRVYEEKVTGRRRLHVLNTSRVTAVAAEPGRVRVSVENVADGSTRRLSLDLLVCATGYHPADPSPLLGDLVRRCARDERGRLLAERDYRVGADPALRAGIYLLGGTEHTHGISASLLSNAAVRAGEVHASLLRSVRAAGEREAGEREPRLVAAVG